MPPISLTVGDEPTLPTREFIRQSTAGVFFKLSAALPRSCSLSSPAPAVYAERQKPIGPAICTQSADDARSQRDIAEREKIEATEQADRSNARAELIQSQLTMMDAPFDALGRALARRRSLIRSRPATRPYRC